MSKSPEKASQPNALNAALEAARQVMATVEQLNARKAELLKEIEPIAARNLRLWRMPCTREEIKQRLIDEVDARAAEFPKAADWAGVFRSYAYPDVARPSNGGELGLEQYKWHTSEGPFNLQDVQVGIRGRLKPILGESSDSKMEEARLFFIAGDLIKAKIEEQFDRLLPPIKLRAAEQEEPELTIAQRYEEISANDDRIALLRLKIGEVDLQLAELEEARGLRPAPTAGGR